MKEEEEEEEENEEDKEKRQSHLLSIYNVQSTVLLPSQVLHRPHYCHHFIDEGTEALVGHYAVWLQNTCQPTIT